MKSFAKKRKYTRVDMNNWNLDSLANLYKELLSQLQGKELFSREDLQNLWSQISSQIDYPREKHISTSNETSKFFLSKLKALLQIMLKTKAEIKKDILSGKMIISENSFDLHYNREKLEEMHSELKLILSGHAKVGQHKLRQYLFKLNQIVASPSADDTQFLFQMKGIIRYLIQNKGGFALSIERGEITIYDNESLASSSSSMLLRENVDYSHLMETTATSANNTVDIPSSLLSNQNFDVSQLLPPLPEEQELTPDLFSSEYQNIYEMSQKNQDILEQIMLDKDTIYEEFTDDSYFKVPHLPIDSLNYKGGNNDAANQTEDQLAGYFSQFEEANWGSQKLDDLDSTNLKSDISDDDTESLILEPPINEKIIKGNSTFKRFQSNKIAITNMNEANGALEITNLLKKITIHMPTSPTKIIQDEDEEDMVATNLRILEELREEFRQHLEEKHAIARSINSFQFKEQ